MAKKLNADAVLAVGGGSAFDTAKGAAFAACVDDENDVWLGYARKFIPIRALPVFGVLTISATGSEMNNSSVVYDDRLHLKWSICNNVLLPRVSIVDPTLQVGLSMYDAANGFIDAIVHILEFCVCTEAWEHQITAFSCGVALIRSIIKCAARIHENPNDINARANFCWAAACALNDFCAVGFPNGGDWAVHQLEHTISAYFPDVAHGEGLCCAFVAFVQANAQRNLRAQTFDRLAREIYGYQGADGLKRGFIDMCTSWNHDCTLDQVCRRAIGKEERLSMAYTCGQRPICGYFCDERMPQDFIDDCFLFM